MARFQGIGMGVAHFFPGWCSASSVLLFCFFFYYYEFSLPWLNFTGWDLRRSEFFCTYIKKFAQFVEYSRSEG